MHRILAKITGKTLTAAAASLAMVGTAGAALGTSYSALEVTDTTSVVTTVDTVAPETTAPDTTVVETTVADTVVETTLVEWPSGANGLCTAMEKAEDRGRPKKTELKSFGRVAGAASAAGVGAGDYCDDVLAAKAAAASDDADDDADDNDADDDDADEVDDIDDDSDDAVDDSED